MTDRTLAALAEALDDERRTHAVYRAVMARFGGDVLPFAQVVQSEEGHIEAVLSLYRVLGESPPRDRWTGVVKAPDTLLEACHWAIGAEKANVAMYDRLLADVDDPRVFEVLSRLSTASADDHLPAFEERVAGKEPVY